MGSYFSSSPGKQLRAAVRNDLPTVEAIIAAQGDKASELINTPDAKYGITVVHEAAQFPEMLKVLLAAGSSNKRTVPAKYSGSTGMGENVTPIFYAISYETYSTFGCGFSRTDNEHIPKGTSIECIKMLIAAGASLSEKTGSTAATTLHAAITCAQPEAVKVLVEAGADPLAKDAFLTCVAHAKQLVDDPVIYDATKEVAYRKIAEFLTKQTN